MKTIGLVGGMSWESSAAYYRDLNLGMRERLGGLSSPRLALTTVDFAEVTHLEDEEKWDQVGVLLADAARGVERAGADFLLLCTTTFHKVADQVEEAVGIPLLHLGDVVAEAVKAAGERYGYQDTVTDWRDLVNDDRIQLFDNCGPNNLHTEPTIAAAEAGKHVICEKPLGRDAAESYETWQRVEAAGVKHMCAFNYRFVPAVRVVRRLVESGELGELRHFRGAYLQEWIVEALSSGL